MSKTAVILAGGKGTRLRPYTTVLPKPLMPLGQYPILEIIIRQLSHCGFKKIVLAVNHQADIIRAYFQDGSKWGVQISYSLETKPLSTIAPLKLISDLPNDFIVMNGDVLTDVNYSDLYNWHIGSRNDFTICGHLKSTSVDFGVLNVSKESKLEGFVEKPSYQHTVSMGVYVANRKILDLIPNDSIYGFDNLMFDMLANKMPVGVFNFNGYWLDIGRPADYEVAIEEFESAKSKYLNF